MQQNANEGLGMSDTTPKQRYDARMALKRQAQEPDHKRDDIVTAEYAFDIAERAVTAFEKLVSIIGSKPTQ
jgi:hypothetical protein